MKLRKSYELRSKKPRDFEIYEAVENNLNDDNYDCDRAQDAFYAARNAIHFLGTLTQKLHERGILSDDDVIELLDNRFKKHDL